jgi:transposase
MRTAATRLSAKPASPTLYVAFELGNKEWRLACTPSLDQHPLVRTIAARALAAVETALAGAKAHFGLPAPAAVRSCYEAGRDGFWLHRYLCAHGIANDVVDSASIEVNRRARRTKSDRLDACKLVTMLLRADAGEEHVWSVVRVPSGADEDRRQLHRELLFVRRDRARLTNRIKGLLANQGLVFETLADLPPPYRCECWCEFGPSATELTSWCVGQSTTWRNVSASARLRLKPATSGGCPVAMVFDYVAKFRHFDGR